MAIPSHFYFSELGNVLNVPVHDPGHLCVDYVEISRNYGVSINEIMAVDFMLEGSAMSPDRIDEIISIVAKNFGITPHKLRESVEKSPFDEKLFERVINAWNNHMRKRLEIILKDNPRRSNVLISVGTGHLPAFSDKYKLEQFV